MWRDVLTTILVIGGLIILTLAVFGVVKMPDVYTRLHAASKAAVLGTLPFLLAAAFAGDLATITRAILIALFLLLTTPVAAHVIAQAAYLTGEEMRTPGAFDEAAAVPQRTEQPDIRREA
jgi:multicomponent Na+:H+ antiporter subunit G